LEKIEEKGKEFKHVAQFLDPEFREKLLSKGNTIELYDKL